MEILEQRIKSRKTASWTRLIPSESRYVPTSSSWFLVRRNEKQESAYYLQISAWFGKYFFSLQVYLGRYMRSSSVTYLVRFLSTPNMNVKQFHCVPLSVCSLTPSFTQVVSNRTMSVTIWAAPSSCTTMSLGSSACLCSNALINMKDVFVFKLTYNTT